MDNIYCNESSNTKFVAVKQEVKGFVLLKQKLEEVWTYMGVSFTTCVAFGPSNKGIYEGGDTFAIGTEAGEIQTFDASKKEKLDSFMLGDGKEI